jgi:hypothetical protein
MFSNGPLDFFYAAHNQVASTVMNMTFSLTDPFTNSVLARPRQKRITASMETRIKLLLLLLALPAAVHAQFTFTTNNGAITITGHTGSVAAVTNVTIPSTITGLPVTSIGQAAFSDCTSLTSVTIPSSVTNIEMEAFLSCASLTNLAIGTNVTSIGNAAFDGCTSLTGVTIPSSVISIGSQAFCECTSLIAITVNTLNSAYSSVTGVLFDIAQTTLVQYPGGKGGSYTIPDSVTNIGDWSFAFCTSITSVTIGSKVTSIGSDAFYWTTSLSTIGVDALNSSYSSADGVLFNKSQTTLVEYPMGKAGSYTVPSTVTEIGQFAFAWCLSLTSVAVASSATSIGDYAFLDCTSLTNVTIPSSVTSIGGYAFSFCTSLTAITVDALNSVYSTVAGVLFNKSQTTLIEYPAGKAGSYTMPNSATRIGSDAFYCCSSLTNITIPNTVTNIGTNAFISCTGLTSVTIPNRVTSIEDGAFSSCTSLSSVMIGTNVTSIGFMAFDGCTSLANVAIPNSVTSIADQAFGGCTRLTNVTIGGRVTSIGDWAFYDCTSLTSVRIGGSVTTIGDYAFSGCTSLTGVYFQDNAPILGGLYVFWDDNNAIGYCLPGTAGWDNFTAWINSDTVLPVIRWNAQVQTSGASFGVRTNRFGFDITGSSGLVIVVEACTNLANPVWSPLQTITLTGSPVYFSDPQWTNYKRRFYGLGVP